MTFDYKSDWQALLSSEKSSIWSQKTLIWTPALKCSGSSEKLINFLWIPSTAPGDVVISAILVSQGCRENVLEYLLKSFFKAHYRLPASWNHSLGTFKDRGKHADLNREPFLWAPAFLFWTTCPFQEVLAGPVLPQPSDPRSGWTEARESWFTVRAHSCLHKSSLMCLSEKFAFLKAHVSSRRFSLSSEICHGALSQFCLVWLGGEATAGSLKRRLWTRSWRGLGI